MRLGLSLGFGYLGASFSENIAITQFAESLGFHSVWTAEAYGCDAIVPLTWLAAHTRSIHVGTGVLQMTARTPALTAMTAATLDGMSGGRMLLGLGVSGPQVVEGWHGEPYGRPLVRTREYVAIVREVLRREKPLEHHGEHYDIPYGGPGSTGLGKPLKSMLHPRPDIPIYLAAIGPKNVALAFDIADGWLPVFFSPARCRDVYGSVLQGNDPSSFDVAPIVNVVMGDDVDSCRNQVKPVLALYIGGMGARGKNFYYDLACRYGYEGQAKTIQDMYLSGKKEEAIEAVPDQLVDEVALCGPPARITELLEAWQASPVSTLIIATAQREAMALLAELVL